MQITAAHKKAIDQYYKELATYSAQSVTHELALKTAFQNLLAAFAPSVNWTLIPEQTLANGKQLMELYLGYEQAPEYPLKWVEK